ncbi:organic cation transporter protein-like isoform X1 [Ornithodoros turicata]
MWSILEKIGPWHIPVLLFCAMRGFPAAQFIMGLTFMAPAHQDHWCAPPAQFANLSRELWWNYSIPFEPTEEGSLARSRCTVYQREADFILSEPVVPDNGTSIQKEPCSEWEYDTSFHSRTVLSEWDVVCQDGWKIGMSQSILMFGFMVGNFIFSHLSDWRGRRPALIGSTLVAFGAGLATVFSTSLTMFNFFRFLASLGHGGIQNVSYTLGIESVAPRRRALVSMLQETGWIVGLILLPGVAYLITDWTYIQVAITLPLLLMLLNAYFLEESPRWLLVTGKMEEAEKGVRKIVAKNRVDVKDLSKVIMKAKEKAEMEKKRQKATIVDLFRSWKIAVISFSTHIQLAIVVLLYYNLIYKIVDFGGNPFLNFFLVSLLEIPVMVVNVLLINFMRRQHIYYALYIPTCIVCLALIFVPSNLLWLQLSLVMLGKLCVHCAYSTLCVHVTECFPTVVRAVALGSSLTASRFGAIVSPFFKDIGRLTYPWVPSVLDASCGVTALCLSLLLPETHKELLPDTFADTMRLRKKSEPRMRPEVIPMQEDKRLEEEDSRSPLAE